MERRERTHSARARVVGAMAGHLCRQEMFETWPGLTAKRNNATITQRRAKSTLTKASLDRGAEWVVHELGESVRVRLIVACHQVISVVRRRCLLVRLEYPPGQRNATQPHTAQQAAQALPKQSRERGDRRHTMQDGTQGLDGMSWRCRSVREYATDAMRAYPMLTIGLPSSSMPSAATQSSMYTLRANAACDAHAR